jgi:type VI secretion system protein ImpC
MPILQSKGSDIAAFIYAGSIQKPKIYDNPEDSNNAILSARLPYVLAVGRFVHYIKCIIRDKIGSFREAADIEKFLNRWINDYVEPNPEVATQFSMARRPLAAAEIRVEREAVEGDQFSCTVHLLPHYHLGGLKTSQRMVTPISSAFRG